jgi:mRNA interferase RelE/StbE
MNVRFESSFEKDLKLVKDRNLLTRLKQIILTCKQAESVGEINNLKKMQGYDSSPIQG